MWTAGRTGHSPALRNIWRRSDEPKRSGSGVSIRCSIMERGGMMRIYDWNALKREHPTFGVPASAGSVSRDTLKRGHQTDRVSLTARENRPGDLSTRLGGMLKGLGYA